MSINIYIYIYIYIYLIIYTYIMHRTGWKLRSCAWKRACLLHAPDWKRIQKRWASGCKLCCSTGERNYSFACFRQNINCLLQAAAPTHPQSRTPVEKKQKQLTGPMPASSAAGRATANISSLWPPDGVAYARSHLRIFGIQNRRGMCEGWLGQERNCCLEQNRL